MALVSQQAGASTASVRALDRARSQLPLLALTGIALAAIALPAVSPPRLRLVWNASASVPLGLYRVAPDASPSVGDLVAVRPSPALETFMAERRYVERHVPLVKPIAAVAGSTVCRAGMHVTIDGRAVAIALPRDRFGRALPRWSGCRPLSAHQLFLIAPDNAASFDSRYFGPVERTQLLGRAIAIWTWS